MAARPVRGAVPPLSPRSASLTLVVGDLAGSTRFYVETLGFRLREEVAGSHAVVELPGLTIGLHYHGVRAPAPPAEGILIGIEVSDLDRAVDALRASGVATAPEEGAAPGRAVRFSDPDGYPYFLIELPRAPEASPPGIEPPGAWADEGGR
jgi:catechol 2,3-dioxygenase-like lactoylglutathione lyase family enzyme